MIKILIYFLSADLDVSFFMKIVTTSLFQVLECTLERYVLAV